MSLPKISIEDLVPTEINAVVVERQHVDGNVSENEIEIISRIVAYLKPQAMFEVGTFDGRTTINMALNAPADAHVYTLDLPAEQINLTTYKLATVGEYSDINYVLKAESGARYKQKTGSEKITQLFGDSATFDYSPYAQSMDLVFIDGSHVREYTKNDTEAAFSMIKAGGIILWHDYASVWPDVTAVLDEYGAKGFDIKHIEGTTLAYLKK